VRDAKRAKSRRWTFAGARANAALAFALDGAGIATTGVDDLGIGFRAQVALDALVAELDGFDQALRAPVDRRRVAAVKFASCVPDAELISMLQERDADERAVRTMVSEQWSTPRAGQDAASRRGDR
jgi:hypothetical protein